MRLQQISGQSHQSIPFPILQRIARLLSRLLSPCISQSAQNNSQHNHPLPRMIHILKEQCSYLKL